MRKICDMYFAKWFRITIPQNTPRRYSAFRILPSAVTPYHCCGRQRRIVVGFRCFSRNDRRSLLNGHYVTILLNYPHHQLLLAYTLQLRLSDNFLLSATTKNIYLLFVMYRAVSIVCKPVPMQCLYYGNPYVKIKHRRRTLSLSFSIEHCLWSFCIKQCL